MRWDNLLAERNHAETAKLPLFKDEALIRRLNTPEFKGITFYEVMAKSIINHVPSERFGFNWTLNPYRGCSHACGYCFARPTHSYLDFNAGKDFETKIVVKVNAVGLLRGGLKKRSWSGESIAMGTNTDNYQRAEGHYKLMRGILKELNASHNPYSILTKSTLIQRDIDLLSEGASKMNVTTSFSVGTVDEEVWRKTEPGTPHPKKRLEVLCKLNEAGVPCGVLMAPILPGISDAPEQLEETVKAIAEAGATHITPIVLHLRPGVKEEFMPWLEENYPQLVVSYEQIYKRSDAPKDVRAPITRQVANLKRRHQSAPPPTRHSYRAQKARKDAEEEDVAEAKKRAEQLSLDLGTDSPRRAPKWALKT